MLTIDAQVHAYDRNHPGRPWRSIFHGPSSASGREMVAAMDAVGVDGAVLVSPYAMYGYDVSYAREVFAAYPGRFCLVKPVDPTDPTVGVDIGAWATTPGAAGVRLLLHGDVPSDPGDPGLNRVLEAAARHRMPVNLLCWGRLEQAGKLAVRHPDTVLVIDHLGLPQPYEPPVPAEPWNDLPKVLRLADHANVVIKISGACTLSREAFPYRDIWQPVRRIIGAFGIERCLWGTDWTRSIALLSYQQGVDAFRLTDQLTEAERAMLMGETLARVYRWRPANA